MSMTSSLLQSRDFPWSFRLPTSPSALHRVLLLSLSTTSILNKSTASSIKIEHSQIQHMHRYKCQFLISRATSTRNDVASQLVVCIVLLTFHSMSLAASVNGSANPHLSFPLLLDVVLPHSRQSTLCVFEFVVHFFLLPSSCLSIGSLPEFPHSPSPLFAFAIYTIIVDFAPKGTFKSTPFKSRRTVLTCLAPLTTLHHGLPLIDASLELTPYPPYRMLVSFVGSDLSVLTTCPRRLSLSSKLPCRFIP
eukprot:Gb_20227 [translate_table: standard]